MVSHGKNYRNGNGKHWRSDEDAISRVAEALQRSSTCTAAIVAMVCTAALLLLLHPGVRYHASETAKAVLASGTPHTQTSADSAYLRHSSDKKGFCRLEYTVKTWDSKNAKVCDPSLCAGRDKLKVMQDPDNGKRRWSAFHESAYMRLFNSDKISGWLRVRTTQDCHCVTGVNLCAGMWWLPAAAAEASYPCVDTSAGSSRHSLLCRVLGPQHPCGRQQAIGLCTLPVCTLPLNQWFSGLHPTYGLLTSHDQQTCLDLLDLSAQLKHRG
jgi:hypothetical protein